MNMREIMKKKAKKASSVTVSNNVVQEISRADAEALSRSMKPIIKQNHREMEESVEELQHKCFP